MCRARIRETGRKTMALGKQWGAFGKLLSASVGVSSARAIHRGQFNARLIACN